MANSWAFVAEIGECKECEALRVIVGADGELELGDVY